MCLNKTGQAWPNAHTTGSLLIHDQSECSITQYLVDSPPDALVNERKDACWEDTYWSSVILDLAVIAVLTAGFFDLAVRFELSERLTHWEKGYESWQVDELPLTRRTARGRRRIGSGLSLDPPMGWVDAGGLSVP